MLVVLCIVAATAITASGSSCSQTSGSYVYFTYCSGYCTGSYGYQYCDNSYTSYYYYYYYSGVSAIYSSLSDAAVAGIVIGCLLGLAVVVAIIVVIVKSMTRSTGSRGGIVQPSTTSGVSTTLAYTTNTGLYGQTTNNGGMVYSGQQPNYNQSYPPHTGYPPLSMLNSGQPPSYNSHDYGGITPLDS